MGRSTQFIGLNKQATEFVKTLIPVDNPENKTFGMFDEEIPLGTWRDNNGIKYFEVEQASPWSSGPLILTALRKEDEAGGLIHCWREDSTVQDEFDWENGRFWV